MTGETEETRVGMEQVATPHNTDNATTNGNLFGPGASLLESPAEEDVLETPAERRGRRRSHLVVYATTFIMSIGFSIVLTGVWPYMRQLDPGVSKEVLGWVIAANPLGQMIASPLMGLWGNRAGSNRGAFVLTVISFCVGNLLYAVLHLFGAAARAVMITSRFIVGVSSANIAIIRSYLAASTTVKERTTAVSLASAAQAIGFIIGPAIQTALAVAFSGDTSGATNSTGAYDMEEVEEDAAVSNSGLQWNMYTATGWIGCFLGLFNLFLFLPCIYKEYNLAAKEARYQKRAANNQTTELPKPDYIALSGILFSFFISVMIYVLLETLMVPMCMDLYAWTDEKAVKVVGIMLSVAACLCLVVFVGLGYIVKVVDERIVFIVGGIVTMTVGLVIFIPMGNTYPKIKNCTSIDSLASQFNESHRIFDPIQLRPPQEMYINNLSNTKGIYEMKGTPVFQFNDTEPLNSHLIGSLDSNVLLRSTSKEPIVETDSTSRILRRQRRHVSRDGDCDDTGCPPEQEWCFYTPIIELPQLGVGGFFSVFGYPVAFSLSSALFSKILGPKPQGVWMGILTSTGSFSRVIGPIVVSYVYTELGTRWTFSMLCCIMLFTFVIDVILYKRMVPMNVLRAK